MLAEFFGLSCAQQEQSEAVFTGKFPAGAGAFEGEVAQIDLGLIGFAAATLAFAPYGGVVGAFGHPSTRGGKVFSGFPGGVVWREGKNLVFGEVQGQ